MLWKSLVLRLPTLERRVKERDLPHNHTIKTSF
jgi:hypothetical protein